MRGGQSRSVPREDIVNRGAAIVIPERLQSAHPYYIKRTTDKSSPRKVIAYFSLNNVNYLPSYQPITIYDCDMKYNNQITLKTKNSYFDCGQRI